MRFGHRSTRVEDQQGVDDVHLSNSGMPEAARRKVLPATRGSVEDQCGRFGAGGVGGPVGLPTGRTPKVNKFALITVGSLTAALTLAGCGSGNPSAQPTPAPTSSATAPAWESSYTPSQIVDYSAALASFEAIQRREAPIWADPNRYTATQAGDVFRVDWSNTSRPLHQLAAYRANGVRVTGQPTVISSQLATITANSGGSGLEQITIRQCVDGSSVRATQHGTAVPPNSPKRGIREIEMFKTETGKYLLFQVGEGTGSC